MFGQPFYRHRLFAANWLWLAPAHPKHNRSSPRHDFVGHGLTPSQRQRDGLNIRPGYETKAFNYPTLAPGYLTDGYAERTRPDGSRGENKIGGPSIMLHDGGTGLSNGTWYGGKNAGWRLAAQAMGIDWMNREELTQAVPPCFTEHIGRQLLMLALAEEREIER